MSEMVPGTGAQSAMEFQAGQFAAHGLAALQSALAEAADFSFVSTPAAAAYTGFYELPVAHGHQLACLPSEYTPVAGQPVTERLVVQCFEPAAPHSWAIVCHGYYDHVGLYAKVITELVARGVRVVSFDQPGHGLSSGARATTDDFGQYVKALCDVRDFAEASGWHLPEQAPHLLGQSMGGSVVMEYLQQQADTQVADVVLLAPLVRPYAWALNQWVFAAARRLIESRPRTVTDNSNNPAFAEFSRHDPLQPRVLPVRWVQAMVNWMQRFEAYPVSARQPLIVQGDADRTVSAAINRQVLGRRFPHARWLWLDGGRHHLANESDAIRAKIWAWLDAEQAFSNRQPASEPDTTHRHSQA